MRCQKITSRGQCRREAVKGSNFCSLHSKQEDMVTAYQLSNAALNDDIRHHARASLADLSQQVVLLRAIVQRRLNMAGDDEASQITAMNFASSQLAAITKMTETMVKLSREAGELMSRVEVEEVIDSIIQIISEELQGADVAEDVVDRIASKIEEELSSD